MSVLIAFATVEGQTGKVAHFVEQQVREAGEATVVREIVDAARDVSFEGIETVVLAASVHERRHPKPFEAFVRENRDALAQCRVLLLSVSLSAAFEDYREEAQDYLDEMKLRTGLKPDAELLVAGAIRPESYDDYAARVLRQAVLNGKSFVPTDKRHEFTDWDELSSTVSGFLKSDIHAR